MPMTQPMDAVTLSPGSMDYRHLTFRGVSPPVGRSRAGAAAGATAAGREEGLGEEERAFVRWLLGRVGVEPSAYREQTLRRRLAACLRALRVATVAEARRAVCERPALLEAAADALLIGVTGFFRDAEVFEALQRKLLPALRNVRGARAGLAAWCAGCSDGAEAYSLAMVLDGLGALEGAVVLGTDCRERAVRRAREGTYDEEALAAVPAGLRAGCSEAAGAGAWRVCERLRRAVAWRVEDLLAAPAAPAAWDVILCRNLGMYLTAEAAGGLWRKLEASLRPGGLLVLGKAERPEGARGLRPAGPCVFRRG